MRLRYGPIDFSQPTTWRGLLGLLALAGWELSPELRDQIAIALAAALSAIEIFRDERAHSHPALPPIALQSLPAPAAAPAAQPERLRQPVPAEPETSNPPESVGFGDR